MLPIHFFYLDTQPTLQNRARLKQFLHKLFKMEHKKLDSLTYIFCTDDYLLSINQSYLNHNFFTDIITFELSEKNKPLLGEIYISVDRVKENAKSMGCSFKQEMHRVIFHGALHLCGYKDKSKTAQQKMRKMEDKFLQLYFS